MNAPLCRLLPYEIADGPENMAADEVLLESAGQGLASLRFYGWREATVSLGYFQPVAVRLNDERIAGLPFVRRPSGGATLVHHHEITYALALPPGSPWKTGVPWLTRMHAIIAAALADLGVVRPHLVDVKHMFAGHLCFQHWTPGDLLVSGAKVTGSAQRKQRGALLQHGAILLEQSPYAPELLGIRELTNLELSAEVLQAAVVGRFRCDTNWQIEPGAWTEAEMVRRARLVETRYSSPNWNERR